ncbi:uncharacterized protein zuc [Epargyreus clarus]|uniref:uncharacterized protein zuc n=1 Tax=Epargyreus clarus TaxID=520877 RepID=UPI003C2CC36A
MSLKVVGKALLVVFSLSFASHVVYNYCRLKKKKRADVNEVIMFSYGGAELRKSRYSKSMISKSMDRLLYYLNSPRYNLDICMYVLTSMDLTNAILKLNFRGVKIRIIIDADMAFSSGSTVKKLEKQGIPVRWMKSTALMHHKFCLIDTMGEHIATPLVIMGSLNWTNNALHGNWEDVTVTSQRQLVEQYRVEFERLWTMFKPIVDI